MKLAIGGRICTFLDGFPRYGHIIWLPGENVRCVFEDDPETEYLMEAGEVYAVAEREGGGRG